MQLNSITPGPGQICQWPNDYPLPGLDPALPNCILPGAFVLEDFGDSAVVCLGHAIAELMRSHTANSYVNCLHCGRRFASWISSITGNRVTDFCSSPCASAAFR